MHICEYVYIVYVYIRGYSVLCVSIYVHVHMSAYVYMCVYPAREQTSAIHSSGLSILLFEIEVSHWPRAHQIGYTV